MKPGAFFLPAAVFALSLATTMAARRRWPAAGETSAAVTPATTSRPTKTHREQNAFDAIKSALRSGDPARSKDILKRLSERDPVAFFELLEKLPGIPGIDDLVRESAARLPWNKPEITSLLNRIGPHAWRDLAWESYGASQTGVRPDDEIMEVVGGARVHGHLSGIQTLIKDAAEKRPEAFIALLNREGGTGIREFFFEEVLKHHPEMADELFASIPDGSPGANYDRGYMLQTQARCLPTAESLMACLGAAGTRGIYSGTFAGLFTYQAYRNANAAEKEKITEAIGSQPALARNRMLAGPLLYEDKPLPADEFNRLASLYTSSYLQAKALEHWIEQQPDLATSDRGWVAQLPTEKMRAKANALLDARAASADKK